VCAARVIPHWMYRSRTCRLFFRKGTMSSIPTLPQTLGQWEVVGAIRNHALRACTADGLGTRTGPSASVASGKA